MRNLLLSFVVLIALTLPQFIVAEEATVTASPSHDSATQREGFNIFKGFRKGARGLCNIATCPLEIPNQMVKESKRHDTFAGAVGGYLAGVPIGCGWMLYRCGAGIWDFVTGPFPTPTYEKSVIQPEYLFPQNPYTADQLTQN